MATPYTRHSINTLLQPPWSAPIVYLTSANMHVFSVPLAAVAQARSEEHVALSLFHDVHNPARDPIYGEHGRVKVLRDSQHAIDRTGPRVDVFRNSVSHMRGYGRRERFDCFDESVLPVRSASTRASSRKRTARGSTVLYTGRPNPEMFPPLSMILSTVFRALSGLLMSSRNRMAVSAAPPCLDPARAANARYTAVHVGSCRCDDPRGQRRGV